MRVGFGSDIHKLVEGRNLVLGGVVVPSDKGELAHSDGDVVYHAIGDAILGALALGDLGKFFPDSDPKYKGIDSSVLLKELVEKMRQKGYKLGNLDVSISLEKPKLRNYIDEMRANIAKIFGSDIEQVSVKAGTNEGLDAVGQGLAVKADCIIAIEKEEK
ncbi:MAG: 2-C-methyl-D-erythritol 2,4-cyclodiphosphate synthase [Bacilli bacterium]|nr:2-C-methyl-D-erythritol 2,4-cyclodiphosphate synthase [Bacilli bacterium]